MKTYHSTVDFRKYMVLIISMFFLTTTYSIVKGQENSLYQEWFLQSGVVNGSDIEWNGIGVWMHESTTKYILFSTGPECQEKHNFSLSNSTDTSFDINHTGIDAVFGCDEQVDLDVISSLYGLFFSVQENSVFLPKNPFTYQIVPNFDSSGGITEGGYLLTLSNGVGDTAVFSSVVLSSPRFTTSSIALSPNPVQAVMHLSHAQTTPLQLQIYDLQGRMIQTQTLLPTQTQIEVQALNPGMYVAVFQNENGERVNKKFLKK